LSKFKINKAIILAGGKGSRMLPWTSAVSKTMLPLIDKPVLHYVVDEIVRSGITKILIVVGHKGDQIIEYFEKNIATMNQCYKNFDVNLPDVEINFALQKEALGTGNAVMLASDWIDDDDVLVAVGDELFHNPYQQDNNKCGVTENLIAQMLNKYSKTGDSIIACKMLPKKDATRFGVIEYKMIGKEKTLCNIIEKPSEDKIDIPLVNVGRYIIKNSLLDFIEKTKFNSQKELALTDVLVNFAKEKNVFCYEHIGQHYDLGNKLEYAKTFVTFALSCSKIKNELNVIDF